MTPKGFFFGRRFVLAPYGSAGDVYPFLWLGAALQRQGASVVVVSSPVFARASARCGLRLVPVGTEEDYHRLASHPLLWHPWLGPWFVLASSRQWFVPLAETIATLLRPAHSVLVASAPHFPATLAARQRRRPHVTVHLQPAAVFSAHQTPLLGHGWRWFRYLPTLLKGQLLRCPTPIDGLLGPALRRACRERGVTPPRRLLVDWWNSPTGVLCLFPEWFAPRQPDWPQPLAQTDFPLFDPLLSTDGFCPDLLPFLQEGSAPLVFTAGSAMGCPGDFFARAARATQALRRRAIFVTAYPEKLPACLPSGILVLKYVSFAHLFPRAAVVIHHGGIGTTAQALAAGVPQLFVPISHDQPDNAERVVRLGCGLSLPLWGRGARALTRALTRLLDEPAFREKALQVARMLPPSGQAADAAPALAAIEQFLRPTSNQASSGTSGAKGWR